MLSNIPPLVLQKTVKSALPTATMTTTTRSGNREHDKAGDNAGDAMPPKEVTHVAAAKKPTATNAMTPPAPRLPANFSINSTNKFAIT